VVACLLALNIFLIEAKKSSEVDLTYKNNFYILLSSSKFYFNYRHSSNVMIFYKYLKERGITDDRVSTIFFGRH
jgi:glycosylphosphatidylinositol transamidase (GPIT) subunit GPI8